MSSSRFRHITRRVLACLVVFLIIVAIYNLTLIPAPTVASVPISAVLDAADRTQVSAVTIKGSVATVKFGDGRSLQSAIPQGAMELVVSRLISKQVPVEGSFDLPDNSAILANLFATWGPYFIGLAVWWWFLSRQFKAIRSELRRISDAVSAYSSKSE